MAACETAIVQGIKTVGVGHRGSRSLTPELAEQIVAAIKERQVTAAAQGAFLGALAMKGLTPQEEIFNSALGVRLFEEPRKIVDLAAPDAPAFIQEICAQLLNRQTLDTETARRVGEFLFSDLPGDGARGLIASILRVRYETPEEYAGLLESMRATVAAAFTSGIADGDSVVQLAEPFDGVDHSYIITPLLAHHIQSRDHRVVTLIGRNSGPKFGMNVADVAAALGTDFLNGNQGLAVGKPALGWYIHQKDLSPALDRWVEIRRQIVKRPFLATLERFLNPARAQVVVASAFHPPYTEKMIGICENAGYPAAVIVRNGLEGTLACGLKRPVKILCSVRCHDASYRRHEIEIHPEKYLGKTIERDEHLSSPSLEENVKLIRTYLKGGRSGNKLFDDRVRVTTAGLEQALVWIAQARTQGERA